VTRLRPIWCESPKATDHPPRRPAFSTRRRSRANRSTGRCHSASSQNCLKSAITEYCGGDEQKHDKAEKYIDQGHRRSPDISVLKVGEHKEDNKQNQSQNHPQERRFGAC
jgi:hypothetical protein